VKALAHPRYLVDAGPLIALLNRRDQWHHWAERALAVITEPLWTSEVLLAEACYNLGQNNPAVRQLLAHVETGHLCIAPMVEEHVARLSMLMGKYERMDLGDGSLVVLSEQFPEAKIITIDTRDFPVYRRFGREPLPLIMPV
jgi:predicted nucleic acid-binding protein